MGLRMLDGGPVSAGQLPAGVAFVSSSNTYTQPQTFRASTTVADASGNGLALIEDIGQDSTHHSGAVVLYGTNGLGGALGAAKQAFVLGIDDAATIPNRDFALSKVLANGGVSDPDGVYISNGGASPSSVGIGVAQPLDNTSSPFRAVFSGGAGQGTLLLKYNGVDNPMGDMLAVGSSNDAQGAFRIRSDGTILAHATAGADQTVADGVLNSTTTVTSATIGWASTDVGRFLIGTGIPSGSYVVSVQSATQVTISLAATATASGVTLTMPQRQFQLRSNSASPVITTGSGAGAGSVVISSPLVGVGPGAPSTPTATLDIVQTGNNTTTLKVRSQSGANLQISSSSTDNQIVTQNAAPLRLGSNGVIAANIDTSANVIVGPAAKSIPAELATGATDAFFQIPTMNGSPSGTPAHLYTGAAPMVIDRTGSKLWFYIGGAWKGVAVA